VHERELAAVREQLEREAGSALAGRAEVHGDDRPGDGPRRRAGWDDQHRAIGGRHDAGPFQIPADLARTSSRFDLKTESVDFEINRNDYSVNWFTGRLGGSGPTFEVVGIDPEDPANYDYRGFFEDRLTAKGDDWQFRTDVEYEPAGRFRKTNCPLLLAMTRRGPPVVPSSKTAASDPSAALLIVTAAPATAVVEPASTTRPRSTAVPGLSGAAGAGCWADAMPASRHANVAAVSLMCI
jgi:hypothetical protein